MNKQRTAPLRSDDLKKKKKALPADRDKNRQRSSPAVSRGRLVVEVIVLCRKVNRSLTQRGDIPTDRQVIGQPARQTDGVTMVKISFQSVAGQKVEKENDGDKTEILIPHPMVRNGSCLSPTTAGCHRRWGSSACCRPAGQSAPARGRGRGRGRGAATASPFTWKQNMHILLFFVSLCTSY